MAENLELNIKVDSNVQNVAKGDAAALSRLDSIAKKTAGSLDFSKEINRSQASLNKLKLDPKGYQQLIKAQKDIREEKKRLSSMGNGGGNGSGGGGGLFGWASPHGGGRIASAIVGEVAGEAIFAAFEKGAELMVEAGKKLFEFAGSIFKSAGDEEKLRLSYRLMLGQKEGKEYREEADRLGKLSGYSGSDVAEQIRPLLSAGMRGERLTQSYALATDIAARKGGGGEAVSEAIEAIRKIELKGGITKKQLIGLGLERNEDFYREMGKNLGISAKAAEKQIDQGKVESQVLINYLSDLVNKQQGGPGGTGGTAYEKTFASRVDRLKKLPEEFFREMVSAPGFQVVSDKMGQILEQLDPKGPNGQKIIAGLTKFLDRIAEFAKEAFTPENIEKFTKQIERALIIAERLFGILGTGAKVAAPFVTSAVNIASGKFDADLQDKIDFQKERIAKGGYTGGDLKREQDVLANLEASGAKVAPANANVTFTQSNTFNGTDPKMVAQLQSTGQGLVGDLEKAKQMGARPR